ncbi:MAG TPA: YceI family protein [Pseudoxanthomonas sp.]|nr:YceI family protein [Pseudoxanthomonas sp.]
MNRPQTLAFVLSASLSALAAPAHAGSTTYAIDPDHTYPSFEADHLGGLSVWRGKFNKSSGKIVLDKQAGKGEVEVNIDMDSADFGNDKMNEAARGDMLFDSAKYPRATYRGRLAAFKDGKPGEVDGELTLHGVTKPLKLRIQSFKCMPHPVLKRELCGADALATFERDDFGMAAGKDYGFDMTVTLRIQVEAIAAE